MRKTAEEISSCTKRFFLRFDSNRRVEKETHSRTEAETVFKNPSVFSPRCRQKQGFSCIHGSVGRCCRLLANFEPPSESTKRISTALYRLRFREGTREVLNKNFRYDDSSRKGTVAMSASHGPTPRKRERPAATRGIWPAPSASDGIPLLLLTTGAFVLTTGVVVPITGGFVPTAGVGMPITGEGEPTTEVAAPTTGVRPRDAECCPGKHTAISPP